MTAERGSRARLGLRAAAAAAGLLLTLAGCGVGSGGPPSVHQSRIAAPVRDIRWSTQAGVVVGVTSDDHIMTVTRTGRSKISPRAVTGVGAGIEPDATRGVVYVPQPAQNQIAVLALSTLRRVGTLHAGSAPSYLDSDGTAEFLLALSADGSTVSGIDLHDDSALPANRVDGAPGSEVDGSTRERRVDYHLVGPRGVTLYRGSASSVKNAEVLGSLSFDAGPSASDLFATTRAYVAVAHTGRIVAIEQKPSADGLHIIGRGNAGAPVRDIAVDGNRIFVLTGRALVVFRTNSFVGYSDGVIPILRRIDYRAHLPGAAAHAQPSGLAVGGGRVYVSFVGQPYLAQIGLPGV